MEAADSGRRRGLGRPKAGAVADRLVFFRDPHQRQVFNVFNSLGAMTFAYGECFGWSPVSTHPAQLGTKPRPPLDSLWLLLATPGSHSTPLEIQATLKP